MGTGGNFDEELTLFQDPLTKDMHVDAIGPSYGDVVHICAWIVQKQDGGDAVAAQITTMTGRPGFEMGTRPSETPGEPPEKYWKLRALQASELPLAKGPAIAMAIALFLEDNKQQSRLWAQPVRLK